MSTNEVLWSSHLGTELTRSFNQRDTVGFPRSYEQFEWSDNAHAYPALHSKSYWQSDEVWCILPYGCICYNDAYQKHQTCGGAREHSNLKKTPSWKVLSNVHFTQTSFHIFSSATSIFLKPIWFVPARKLIFTYRNSAYLHPSSVAKIGTIENHTIEWYHATMHLLNGFSNLPI